MMFPCLVDDNENEPFEEEDTSSDEETVKLVLTKPDIVREKKTKKTKIPTKKEQFFDSNSQKIVLESSEPAVSNESGDSFSDLNLSRPMLKAVFEAGFVHPTQIQKVCIPVALAGRDICACSATGTGKTAAFMLPIFERMLFRQKGRRSVTRVLVLVPTRELAIQVFQVSRKLSQFSQVDICLCAGGLDLKAQEAALRLSPDVVIATPGRLIDHLHNSPNFSLADIEVLVLDEADRMLEEAFADQMKELIRLCSVKRQTMLFSATMTDEIEDLAKMSLKKPVKLFINENTDTAMNLHQEYVRIRDGKEEDREAIVAALITRNFTDHTIVFARTKRDCERLNILLRLLGVKAGQLHGGLTQNRRIQALHDFKTQKLDVLCSTDLAARGLDVEGVMTVINMHMPSELKHYIHRVGRTARAGKVGRSISLVCEQDRAMLKQIIKLNSEGRPLQQRTIAMDVIVEFKEKIDMLGEEIDRVVSNEKVEREMHQAEESLQKAEMKIHQKEQEKERTWFLKQTAKKEKKVDQNKNKERQSRGGKEKIKDPEEIRAQHFQAFQAREAKRSKRFKRMRAIGDEDAVFKSKKKKNAGNIKVKWASKLHDEKRANQNKSDLSISQTKSKKKKIVSSFTQEIANVGSKAVKRFRHGPDDMDFKKEKRAKMQQGSIRGPKRGKK